MPWRKGGDIEAGNESTATSSEGSPNGSTGENSIAKNGTLTPFAFQLLFIITGIVTAASTFIPWISVAKPGLDFSLNGWDLMWTGRLGARGNLLVSRLDGAMILSGFWSLLLGALILIGVMITLRRIGTGLILVRISGLLGVAISVIDIVMIHTRFKAPNWSVSSELGLWLFAGISTLSCIMGVLGRYVLKGRAKEKEGVIEDMEKKRVGGVLKRIIILDIMGAALCIAGIALNWSLGLIWGVCFFVPGLVILVVAQAIRIRNLKGRS